MVTSCFTHLIDSSSSEQEAMVSYTNRLINLYVTAQVGIREMLYPEQDLAVNKYSLQKLVLCNKFKKLEAESNLNILEAVRSTYHEILAGASGLIVASHMYDQLQFVVKDSAHKEEEIIETLGRLAASYATAGILLDNLLENEEIEEIEIKSSLFEDIGPGLVRERVDFVIAECDNPEIRERLMTIREYRRFSPQQSEAKYEVSMIQ